ncbi:hypothetical protein XELAEV_18001937mg [Xenopus laevis]|nr:hypothetical protein XELAEV_18001937mg [Xenopus laevis]
MIAPHKPATPLWGNPEFPPGLETAFFMWCRIIQIKYVKDLYQPAGIMSWESSENKFHPPIEEKFHFLQSLMMQANIIPPLYIKTWEQELHQTLDPKACESIWKGTNKCSINLNQIETSYKILTHWYFTPMHLNKMFPSQSKDCFRKFSQTEILINEKLTSLLSGTYKKFLQVWQSWAPRATFHGLDTFFLSA